ncbi:MAG TPA: Gfo/Idh/MocA family oxidoreductase [Candidatus Binataceae bacterium]|jgi:predicted dehydrogenase|nr:Gfo/Idh/MocA family oxidoreductase [Candidatus Binataceae bacterium]
MRELRAAVVGAGRLGALHAAKYAALPGVRLTCVVDIDPARAERVARLNGADMLTDYRDLLGRVDLVSVATPTVTHIEITAALLAGRIDVLVEKPMTATVEQARELAALAQGSSRILQVGHLERFNPAVMRSRPFIKGPKFIECHRLAPFTERGTDVDVIFDLMVHDLDVILSITGAEVAAVEAVGVAVLTERIDIANARLRFDNGMIANLVTSRVSQRRERKIRFFQADAYISLDYEARTVQIYRRNPPPPGQLYPTISAERIDLGEGDPLADEIADFVSCARSRSMPQVGVTDGLRVVELCELISSAIKTV